MTAHILDLTPDLHRDLWNHLLPVHSSLEQAAFLFCTSRTANGDIVFEAMDKMLLGTDDFAAQYDDYLELTDACRRTLIKRAYDHGAMLVELHSHPKAQSAAFSLSDLWGLQETVPHMRWRLQRRPYIAIVVTPTGLDALVWTQEPTKPRPLSGIRVETVLHKPTNASLRRWYQTMDTDNRFDRNELLFGKEGQQALRRTRVAIVGVGGLGTHVVQQLALLGVGELILIDHEELSASNRNRYIGAWHDDPIPGSFKVELGQRLSKLIDPSTKVSVISDRFPSSTAFKALRDSDYVFGCVDSDGVRFVLNETCLAYERPYFDLASDVPEPNCYGGRVVFVTGDNGCLSCQELLCKTEVRQFLSPPEILDNEDAVYGIPRRNLDEIGPSVVSLNGVVASLGVTEFMAAVTGIRQPNNHLDYRGDRGTVGRRTVKFTPDCYYCNEIKGQGDAAEIERYIRQ